MWRGLFRDEDIHALVLFVGGEHLLFVIAALGVDFPRVEFRATEESEGGVVAGEHGVVLVVVAVHAVAADGLEVREALEVGPEGVHMGTVFGVVNGVSVEFADHMAFEAKVGFFGEPEVGDFGFGEVDEVGVGFRPEVVAAGAKVFHAEHGAGAFGNHVGGPVAEILDAADADFGGVDVDPIVGENVGLAAGEGDDEEVAVTQAAGGFEDHRGCGGGEVFDERGNGHRGDDFAAADRVGFSFVFDFDGGGAAGLVVDADGAGVCDHAAAEFFDFARATFPEHAGPEAGVVEGFDEGFHLAAVPQGVEDGGEKAEAVDALGGPVGADFRAGDAPDFFGVGFEEGAVKAVAEAVSHPALERILGEFGLEAHAHIAGEHEEALEEAEIADSVRDLEGVLVEFVPVENAGEAGDLEHGLVHHFGPEALHIGALREKPVAADVDAVVAPAVGARDAADVWGGLENQRAVAGFGEFERGGEAGGPSSDHKVRRMVGEEIQSGTIIE